MSKHELIDAGTLPPVFGGNQPRSVAELRTVIQQAMDAWLSKTESERTRQAYRQDVEQFLDYLGINPTHIEHMTRVLPEDVTAWRDHLLKQGGRADFDGTPSPGANSTVARKMTSIRSFFSFLQSYGYRGANPAHPHFVATPKVPDEGQTPAIPPKMMSALLRAPDIEKPTGIRDRAILSVFAYMAVRVDELHQMNVGNITQDGEHTVIKIRGKGNSIRKGVIPPVAATAVNQWIETAGIIEDRRGPLFRPGNSPRGGGADGFRRSHMTIRAIQKLVKKYCQEVGIDQAVSVHSLRVTAATEADRAGVPLNQIQQWLGHRDPRTTLRYIRTGQDLDRSPAYTLRY
ncbi:tyrosine-type recombinase/integrase [Crateriforma conspicua]|uniref:tyrosine-type recombinase/integrase n=1 Tax=Crateriforma conspicua TaxID=2527996 RepID=UPI00118C1D1A|nr:tyrosine-type recombinase/integrase [Crateriforma conspicua]QDV66085.1 Tyrosine recombinase XerD [Crateriforma conspicua]